MARMNKILVIAAMAAATTALAVSAAHMPRPVVFETPADDELRGARVSPLSFFAEFPDVVLDAGYEVCLDRVPVPAKPVWRHFREIGPFVLCFHAYSIA